MQTHDAAEHAALSERFERAPAGAKARAKDRLAALQRFNELVRVGASTHEAERAVEVAFGISPTTLWRLRKAVKGHSPDVWLFLLLPKWSGRTATAAMDEDAWLHYKADYGRLQRPAHTACYRRLLPKAIEMDWRVPSLSAVIARWDALPEWERVLLREGIEALSRRYPPQYRDYTTLNVHDLWVADGRKHDLFVRFPDGQVGRPIVVTFEDVRTRVVLGWAIGRTESADLIRLAMLHAIERAGALPNALLLDNGRGFASKMLSGGTPRRNRFKIRAEDLIGIFVQLGIEVIWATPGHGQAKPIERYHRTMAEMDRRPEFAGAYCGNKPDAKPEDCDPSKAVPLALFERILEEEIEGYCSRPHRGDGMDGRSPRSIYEELLASASPRQPSATQLRMCMLAADSITLQSDGFRLLGNRYWSPRVADLPVGKRYTLRFDPSDARRPVAVYRDEKYVCEAALIDPVGFRDQTAAKEHARARSAFLRAKKDQVRAEQKMAASRSWSKPSIPEAEPPLPSEQRSDLPRAKVVKLLRPVTEPAGPPESDGARGGNSAPDNDDQLLALITEFRRKGTRQ